MLQIRWLVCGWPSGGPSVQTDRQMARWPNIFTGPGAPPTDRPGGKLEAFHISLLQNKHTQTDSLCHRCAHKKHTHRMECDSLITQTLISSRAGRYLMKTTAGTVCMCVMQMCVKETHNIIIQCQYRWQQPDHQWLLISTQKLHCCFVFSRAGVLSCHRTGFSQSQGQPWDFLSLVQNSPHFKGAFTPVVLFIWSRTRGKKHTKKKRLH